MTYQAKLDALDRWPGAPYRMPCLKEDGGWECAECPLDDDECIEIRQRKDGERGKREKV